VTRPGPLWHANEVVSQPAPGCATRPSGDRFQIRLADAPPRLLKAARQFERLVPPLRYCGSGQLRVTSAFPRSITTDNSPTAAPAARRSATPDSRTWPRERSHRAGLVAGGGEPGFELQVRTRGWGDFGEPGVTAAAQTRQAAALLAVPEPRNAAALSYPCLPGQHHPPASVRPAAPFDDRSPNPLRGG
jgi:hypothetical protein